MVNPSLHSPSALAGQSNEKSREGTRREASKSKKSPSSVGGVSPLLSSRSEWQDSRPNEETGVEGDSPPSQHISPLPPSFCSQFSSGMRLAIILLFVIGVIIALRPTCYPSKTTKNPYELLGRETVETKRGCEVLCDADAKCAGFAFKDLAFNSSCVLLKNRTKENQVCSAPSTMFLKKFNCDDRTNLTEEFGVETCIDNRVDEAFRGLDQYPPCIQNRSIQNRSIQNRSIQNRSIQNRSIQNRSLQNRSIQNRSIQNRSIQNRSLQYFIRAIDSNGNRITLDNENLATITAVKDGGMFAYYWRWEGNTFIRYIVAATCVQAGLYTNSSHISTKPERKPSKPSSVLIQFFLKSSHSSSRVCLPSHSSSRVNPFPLILPLPLIRRCAERKTLPFTLPLSTLILTIRPLPTSSVPASTVEPGASHGCISMDLLVDTDLTLATLPADVIRTIIQMEVPESIDNLRLRLPVIEKLSCHYISKGDNSKLVQVEIFRSHKYKRHITYSNDGQANMREGESAIVILQISRAISRCAYIDTLTLNIISALKDLQKYFNN
ncbi:hypothetical protein PRIPAC_70083, partial [Pristionchus pacificus]|uniref:Apple domain-containing protein n=1 Tax=Pristionchus pacificus TaxID=54126 RepID=A0A2A6BRD4_PRIPA